MKKRAIDWFSTVTDQRLKSKLLYNSTRFPLYPEAMCLSLEEAIAEAFDWYSTPEGSDYWMNINKGYDPVQKAEHYDAGIKEVWEMMVDIWGAESFKVFCEINAFKYRMRAGKKGVDTIEQDIEKAMWYEEKAKNL